MKSVAATSLSTQNERGGNQKGCVDLGDHDDGHVARLSPTRREEPCGEHRRHATERGQQEPYTDHRQQLPAGGQMVA